MTPANLVRATQGMAIPGLTILQKIDDPLRLCTIYATDDGDLVVGFGGTRDNWLDWLLNLDPTIEARTLIEAIRRWIHIYRPSTITLAGHSQGGAHALFVGLWLADYPGDVSVVTFGGLPTGTNPGCKVTNYLTGQDPMGWIPWGLLGLDRQGSVIRIGHRGWPNAKGHEPAAYIREAESIEKEGEAS